MSFERVPPSPLTSPQVRLPKKLDKCCRAGDEHLAEEQERKARAVAEARAMLRRRQDAIRAMKELSDERKQEVKEKESGKSPSCIPVKAPPTQRSRPPDHVVELAKAMKRVAEQDQREQEKLAKKKKHEEEKKQDYAETMWHIPFVVADNRKHRER